MTPADLTRTRESLHLNQSELARVLGVAVNTVSRWEHGSRAIPPYMQLTLIGVSVALAPRIEIAAATSDTPEWIDVTDRVRSLSPR